MKIHEGQPVIQGGSGLGEARAALVLLHGRGASAEDIFSLGEEIASGLPGLALLAPQAAGHAWYPQRFLAPLAQNEPGLSSALAVVAQLIAGVGAKGVPPERVILIGFSQGACLALEFAARHARRYGGVVGLSGGVIGPPGTVRKPSGSLAGTPVYLGCGDRDFHIPVESVNESARVLGALGAAVQERIFPGMEHTINAEEMASVRLLVQTVCRD